MNRLILSLFDHSGAWSQPYTDAGYAVVRVCLPDRDVREYAKIAHHTRAHGVLAAPPCDEFAGSGARWWASKPPEKLQDALELVDCALRIIAEVRPSWWAIENPIGRLRRLRPELGSPRLTFDPCDYAAFAPDPESERYTKRTQLFGSFAPLSRAALSPTLGSKMHRIAPSPERKHIRSQTPRGFAQAFFLANP